jgi:energy-coupling factor transporter ATP-binding protein EcfA2
MPPPEGPAHLEARGVAARRGGAWALGGVDLRASPGQVVAVTGPNGSGKSTLLEVLALLRRPDRGEVLLCGRPASADDAAARRRVTLAMQPALLFRRSVEENVLYGLRARGVERHAASRRAAEALERTGAAALAPRPADRLSAGERQRVNLARALALPVDVLLLDEPTANLDAAGARAVLDLLDDLRREARQAIVVATPEAPDLLALADTLVRLAPNHPDRCQPPPHQVAAR